MTIDQIKEKIKMWEEADAAIIAGKSYSVDGLTYTRQDAQTITKMIEYWSNRLARVMRGGSCVCGHSVQCIDHERLYKRCK